MLPAYIIHNSDCEDRREIVANLIDETCGDIVEAIFLENRLVGCCASHLKVANHARKMYPHLPYLVLEDDCVLHPGWGDALWDLSGDVIYLGYNDIHPSGILFGTHAMIVTPKARDVLIENLLDLVRQSRHPAYDWLAWQIWKENDLHVDFPKQKDIYCEQMKGLKSTISGSIR